MENKPYLIQRAKFEDRPNREGIDGIVSFDYMGSAEFEFGALHKSLTRIRSRLGEYVLGTISNSREGLAGDGVKNALGQDLMVFSRLAGRADLVEIIQDLKHDRIRLKEWSGFKDWFKPEANIPGLAYIKRHMLLLDNRHGVRTYVNDSRTIRYRNFTESGKIELDDALGLKFNLWWDIDHDWLMMFCTPEQSRKLMEKIGFVSQSI